MASCDLQAVDEASASGSGQVSVLVTSGALFAKGMHVAWQRVPSIETRRETPFTVHDLCPG